MAYPRTIKRKAMELFGSGQYTMEQVAEKIGVHYQTIVEWKAKDKWEEFRQEVADRARREAADRLSKARADMAVNHFEDLELLRGKWKATMAAVVDMDGQPREMTPGEYRQAAAAYKDLLAAQRLVFGQDTEKVGLSASTQQPPSDADMFHAGAIEAALSKTLPATSSIEEGPEGDD